MRGFVPFLLMLASGAVASIGICAVAGLPFIPMFIGFACGGATLLAGSIVANSCNAARYGRCVWDEGQHSDFDEVEVESPWGDSQRAGYHVAGMRLDRVRRHPEAPATFPAGEPQ